MPFGRGGQFGPDTRVRHLIGLDPRRGGVAVADTVAPGMRLAFCLRDVVRNCTEIRDEVEAPAPQAFLHTRGDALDAAPKRIQWAIYVSCSGRGGPPFGGTSAELKLAQMAGRMLEKEPSIKAAETVFRQLRDAYMTVGRSVAPELVGLQDVRQIEVLINAEMRRTFERFEKMVVAKVEGRT